MERLSMSKTKEILRLRWAVKLSVREVSRATGASTGVVSATESRACRAGVRWEQVESMDCEWTRRISSIGHRKTPIQHSYAMLHIHRSAKK